MLYTRAQVPLFTSLARPLHFFTHRMFPVYMPCSISQSDSQLLTMVDNGSFCIWGPTENPGEQQVPPSHITPKRVQYLTHSIRCIQWILERRGSNKVVLRNLKFNKYAGVSGTLQPSAEVSPTIQPIELTMESSLEDDHYR
jgi:hypothetical protein